MGAVRRPRSSRSAGQERPVHCGPSTSKMPSFPAPARITCSAKLIFLGDAVHCLAVERGAFATHTWCVGSGRLHASYHCSLSNMCSKQDNGIVSNQGALGLSGDTFRPLLGHYHSAGFVQSLLRHCSTARPKLCNIT